MVKADIFHRPKVIDFDICFIKSTYRFVHAYRQYADGDYMQLYNMLFKYDYCEVHSNTSVDAAVGSVSAAVSFAMFSLFLVVLSEEPNNFLGFLSLQDNTYVRRIPFIKDLKRKTRTICIVRFQNIVNLSKLPSNPNGLPD